MVGNDVLARMQSGLIAWLQESGLKSRPIASLIDGYCERLVAIGVPLQRVRIGFFLNHPLYGGHDFSWTAETGETRRDSFLRNAITQEGFRQTPFFHLLRTEAPRLRCRLSAPGCDPDFDLYDQLRDDHFTDYLALFHSYGRAADLRFWADRPAGVRVYEGVVSSFATRRLQGFDDAEIALIEGTVPALALAIKAVSTYDLSADLLETYLGRHSGKRVLQGQTTRGDVDRISCVIWYSDLRESTRLAETMALDAYLALLNTYFQCTAGAVLEHGGEVLKFIGDGVMAIFPFDDAFRQPQTMAQAALAAAHEALALCRQVRDAPRESERMPLKIGLALHVGEVAYGNVGLPRRLDFTVIGAAANEVARLERLCKSCGVDMVASAEFAAVCPLDLASLGRHDLRGVGHPLEIFTLPEAEG